MLHIKNKNCNTKSVVHENFIIFIKMKYVYKLNKWSLVNVTLFYLNILFYFYILYIFFINLILTLLISL